MEWRRLLKVAIVLAVTLTLSATVGRKWAYGVLMLPLLGAAYVHLRSALIAKARRQWLDW